MTKTRVQLSAIAFLLGCFGYLLIINIANSTDVPSFWKVLLMFVDITFLAAAVGILGCTFIRARQLPDGSVCFMPNHPLIKLGFVGKGGTNLCPTFWSVSGVITVVALLVLGSLLFLAKIVIATVNGNFIEEIGLPTLVLIVLLGTLILFIWLTKKELWIWKVPVIVLVSLVAIPVFYLYPMAIIEENYGIVLKDSETWIAGTIIYLNWVGAILASLVGVATLIYLAFKYWTTLANSWLGKQIALLKEKLCVRFVKCDQSN